MALHIDGVEVTDVTIDGVDVDEVHLDGLKVWPDAAQLVVDLSGVPSGISDLGVTPQNGNTTYSISANGTHYYAEGQGVTTISPEWLVEGTAIEYEIRATLQSGQQTDTGSFDTWESLNSTRTWFFNQSSIGSKTCSILFEVRRAVGFELVASTVLAMLVTTEN